MPRKGKQSHEAKSEPRTEERRDKDEGGHRDSKLIRMPPALWESLGELGSSLKYKDKRGPHSWLIREMVSAAITKWNKSPYVCRSARHVIFVTRDGTVFFRQIQDLKLNTDRKKLPCLLEMKPEKLQDFFEESQTYGDKDFERIKSRWLINHFGVWHGREVDGKPLDAWVDRAGIDVKMADLAVEMGAGAILTREIVAGIKDYVQWREGEHGDDRVDLPIDIPTRNLEIVVVVDLALYRNTELDEEEIHDLKMEFRNRELARFEGDGIAHDQHNPMGDPVVGRHLQGTQGTKAAEISEHIRELRQRIEILSSSEVKGLPVVPPEQRAALLKACEMPESFLFYKSTWQSPYFGLVTCVRWAKAQRIA